MAEPVCFFGSLYVVIIFLMFTLAPTSTNNLGSYVQSDEKY